MRLNMASDLKSTGVIANGWVLDGLVNTHMTLNYCGIPREELVQPNVMQAPKT
jgi:hypothetical protein